MTPDQAMDLLMGWFPVIMIGVILIGYVVSMIRDMWNDRE